MGLIPSITAASFITHGSTARIFGCGFCLGGKVGVWAVGEGDTLSAFISVKLPNKDSPVKAGV